MEFLDRYKFDFKTDILGQGGFGEVYRAYDTLLNRDVALKFYRGGGSSKYDLISEIKNVIKLNHPNLLKFYDASILSQQNAFGQYEDLQVGIMEFANEGDLIDFMQTNPSKEEIKIVLLGILSGLSFMHKNGFIHRDLKPQNILFVKKGRRITPKIADFGISKNALGDNSAHSTKLIGTVEYMAPEQFNSKFGIDGKPSYNLDLWAIGVMLYELLSGAPAYGKRSDTVHTEHIMHNICYEEISKDIDKIEEPFRSVLGKCLVKDANKRVKSADELIEFITGYKEGKTSDSQDMFVVSSSEDDKPKPKPKAKPGTKPKPKTEKKATVEKKKSPLPKIIAGVVILGVLAAAAYFLYPILTNNNQGVNNELTDNNTIIDEPADTITPIEEVIDTNVVEAIDTLLADSLNENALTDQIVEDSIVEEVEIEEEIPVVASGEKMSIAALLTEYNNCNSNNSCASFTAKAVCKYYGIEDLKRDGVYINNFDIYSFVSTNSEWKSLGLASDQQTLDNAQQMANLGIPVIAINIGDQSNLAVMVVKGNQSMSSTWNRNVPACAGFLPAGNKPITDKSLNWVWKSPAGIQLWSKP